MELTLLDTVQDMLASIDSDTVNSINDTPEAEQAARIARSTFFDIVTRDNLPEHFGLISLDASTDGDMPTVMTIPSGCSQLLWVKYDNHTVDTPQVDYRPVSFQTPAEFFNDNNMLNEDEDGVGSFTFQGFHVRFRNDRAPEFYTIIGDDTLVFNSYDAAVDTTLQQSKTMCYAVLNITFSFVDNFVIPLNDQQTPLFLNECKSMAWAVMKQSANPKIEQAAKRGWTAMQKTKTKGTHLSELDRLPNYGRHR